MHGSNVARFEEGYRTIARAAKLPGRDGPNVDILQLVHSWLCSAESGKWVIIVDNADESSVFFSPQSTSIVTRESTTRRQVRPLSAFLPQSANGAILITTRNRDTAFRFTGQNQDIIKVGPMDQKGALTLLEKKLGIHFESESGAELIGALEYIPLAITQAAAYIYQRAPRMFISKYLEELQKSKRSRASLLNYDIGDTRRDESASNSIITTWQISFEHIRATRPSAADLLSLMSFFDRQGIPEDLLNDGKREDSSGHNTEEQRNGDIDTESEDGTADGFEEDVTILRAYSLISTEVQRGSFEMHRLVQLSTRQWLEIQGELERWKQEYISKMCRALPTGDYQNWSTCQRLFPHAEAAVGHRPTDKRSLKEWAYILNNAGWYAWTQGKYTAAGRMARKAVATRQDVLGAEHLDTLMSLGILASVLQGQGKYEQAEEMNRRALEGYEKALGKEHPSTLASVYRLAYLLYQQEQYQDALPLYQRAYVGYEKALGRDHPTTEACSKYCSLLLEHSRRIYFLS